MKNVTVYIWRSAKTDTSGEVLVTDFAQEGLRSRKGTLGHVALEIEDEFGNKDYISYRPLSEKQKLSLRQCSPISGCFQSKDHDEEMEGNQQNKITITFETLDVEAIRKSNFFRVYKTGRAITWQWKSVLHLNTSMDSEYQNACTIVWSLLKIGGIEMLNPKRGGPSEHECREKYRCNDGQIIGGFFDNFEWRDWVVSPTFILHLTSSAKEEEQIRLGRMEKPTTPMLLPECIKRRPCLSLTFTFFAVASGVALMAMQYQGSNYVP